MNDTQFGNWSNGPGWLSWSRGQSMHGVGAHSGSAVTLPQAWMTSQSELQKKILEQMRNLGIIAVLPVFQGNVPPIMSYLHPTANISVQGGKHFMHVF